MSIAEEVSRKLTGAEIDAIVELSRGATLDNVKTIKRLKELGIHDPKSKRPITLYGSRVVIYLKEYGRWPD